MSSDLGKNIRLSVFGQSHGQMIGAVIDGLPCGVEIDTEALQQFVDRRAPGRAAHSTARRESDKINIVSGLYKGKTCGAPLALLIANSDAHSADYEQLKNIPRPGHADHTAALRYGGSNDPRGGGHFSGRLTAPITATGGICLQILAKMGINVGAHIAAIGGVEDMAVDSMKLDEKKLRAVAAKSFPVFDDKAGEAMNSRILAAAEKQDSTGGIIEVFALGVPAGIGSPMFGGVENRLAAAVFGIPGVKGVEFGSGFGAANMCGSSNNDAFCLKENAVVTKSNSHGGILGGITSGMPLVMRVAIKPTPSIGCTQYTLNTETGAMEELNIQGRHDPCIVPRAVPCLEAVTGFVLLDMMLDGEYKTAEK